MSRSHKWGIALNAALSLSLDRIAPLSTQNLSEVILWIMRLIFLLAGDLLLFLFDVYVKCVTEGTPNGRHHAIVTCLVWLRGASHSKKIGYKTAANLFLHLSNHWSLAYGGDKFGFHWPVLRLPHHLTLISSHKERLFRSFFLITRRPTSRCLPNEKSLSFPVCVYVHGKFNFTIWVFCPPIWAQEEN